MGTCIPSTGSLTPNVNLVSEHVKFVQIRIESLIFGLTAEKDFIESDSRENLAPFPLEKVRNGPEARQKKSKSKHFGKI